MKSNESICSSRVLCVQRDRVRGGEREGESERERERVSVYVGVASHVSKCWDLSRRKGKHKLSETTGREQRRRKRHHKNKREPTNSLQKQYFVR